MARPPRLLIPGAIYHVTVRGNERRPIYRDANDRNWFLEILGEVVEETGWRQLSYCLMGNHFHLLTQTPEPNLAFGMHQLNGRYAQAFNRRHDRVGHLFQGRYGAKLVQDDAHLHATVRYIVRNPVRAGLCQSPRDWPWSSHRSTLGETRPPPFLAVDSLLGYFGPNARWSYRKNGERADDPDLDRYPLRPPRAALSTLLAAASEAELAAAQAEGYSLREIARHLGVNPSTVSRRLRRHCARNGATPGV
ncbi:MAG TPA: transposase [Gaiellaceae bacterium]|nr:transposase [Gaiellaceae bacterium]